MRLKNIIIAVIIAVLILILLTGLDFNLYRSNMESRNNKSVTAVDGRNFTPVNYAASIGILINDLESEKAVKERLAVFLKDYLLKSGYQEVYLLQSGDYSRQSVDLIIRANLDSDLSRLPFHKKGAMTYNFHTHSLYYGPEYYDNERVSVRYSGEDRLVVTGIISQRRALDLLLENISRGFVQNLNQVFNEKFQAGYQEKLDKLNPSRKKIGLRNETPAELLLEYSDFLPDRGEGVFIYQDKELGKRALISLNSRSTVNELLEFYQGLIDEKFQGNRGFANYINGRKVYQNFEGQEKLLIDIKYLKTEEPFSEERELEKKIVNIFYWQQSPAVTAVRDLYGFYPESDPAGLKEELTGETRNGEKDFAYYYALSKIRLIELKQRYWQEGILDQGILDSAFSAVSSMANLTKYPGAAKYYQGRIYQELGNLLRSSEYLAEAAEQYQGLEQRYGIRYFGRGAGKQLLKIKANPFYEEKDYTAVLKQLDSDKYSGIDLTRSEILFRMGRYEEAYRVMKDSRNWEDRQLKLITKIILGKPVKPDDYPEDIRAGSIEDIRWTLTRAFILKRTGKTGEARKEIRELKERCPAWIIFEESGDLSRKMGAAYDLISYLEI